MTNATREVLQVGGGGSDLASYHLPGRKKNKVQTVPPAGGFDAAAGMQIRQTGHLMLINRSSGMADKCRVSGNKHLRRLSAAPEWKPTPPNVR